VPAAYPPPAADLAPPGAPLPAVLDAAAASVGMRVTRGLDGAVRVMSAASALALLAANLALPGATRRAGGLYSLAG
jgi:hypothetical protein